MSTPGPNRSLRSLWSERFQRGFRHSPGRLVVFGLFVFAGSRAPVELKSLLYGLAFLAALWGFFALTREVAILVGFLPGLLRGAGRKLTKVLHSSWSGWPRVGFLLGLVLLGIVVWRAWPTWHFQATTSLREDETLNVAQYTSQGFGKAVGDYARARNHIFYNVLNAILPGASSTWPVRARLLSFLGVACGLGAMIVYGWWRGWFLSACFFAGLVALNSLALRTLLEARGYGLLFFFAMVAAIAFSEWSRSRSPRWLVVLAVAAVCGGYTLPYFIVFGGGLLFVAFCARPSQTSFSTGLLALAALLILYVPVLADVARVALSYGETYGGQSTSNYDTMDSLFHTLQFFVPHQVAKASPALALGFLAVALATIGFGRFAPPPLRLSVAGISACLFGCLTFFYLVRSVPIRTGAFLAAPLLSPPPDAKFPIPPCSDVPPAMATSSHNPSLPDRPHRAHPSHCPQPSPPRSQAASIHARQTSSSAARSQILTSAQNSKRTREHGSAFPIPSSSANFCRSPFRPHPQPPSESV